MMKRILLIIIMFQVSLIHQINAQCSDSGNEWSKSWVSCETSSNPNAARNASHWILYEFTENHYIDSSYVWNANRVGESTTGLKDVIIDYSLDGNTWIELGSYTFPQGTEAADYQGFQGPVFGSQYISKILITVQSIHGNGSCASLGEIQFQVDNSKCHGIMDACGECNGPGMYTYYLDADGDGKGRADVSVQSCEPVAGYVLNIDDDCDGGQLGWDDISPIFQASCNGCHIAQSVSGLNLGTFESFMMGGDICGTSITQGEHLVGIITIPGYNCQPDSSVILPMNTFAGGNAISEANLQKIQMWIDGGAPELCDDFCIDDQQVDMVFQEGTVGIFSADQSINSAAQLDSATIITYEAGQEIILNAGFSVLLGGQFIAQLGGCE